MLVTDPKQRMTMGDIMNHAWITKGFNTPPENYLPHREPLSLPLDPQIIEKMTGFDFGPAEYITRELTKVLSSEEYQNAVRLNAKERAAQAAGGERKRGVLDFYKRRNSTTSRDTLPNSSSEAVQFGSDPVNAFSPLISIYYLAREKQERERAEANPGAFNLPTSPGETPLQMPDLPAPEAAYTNTYAHEMPGEKATGGRTRARSRTQGEEEVVEDLRKTHLNIPPAATAQRTAAQTTETPSTKKESTGMGLLRRFSTRRGRESRIEKADNAQHAPSLQLPPSDLSNQPRKSFSVRRSRNREPTPAPLMHPGGSTPHQAELLTPASGIDARSRTSNTLDRSASVNSADYRKNQSRRGVSDGQPAAAAAAANLEPPLTSGSERSSIVSGHKSKMNDTATPQEHKPSLTAQSIANRTRSLGHGRRESMQVRRSRRAEGVQESDLPEENEQDILDHPENLNKSSENLKPVYLKGLFSVSTTSNKPLAVIRMDIIRVLTLLRVSYTEIKGGFSCQHAPSVDLNREEKTFPDSPELNAFQPNQQHRRRISFAGGLRNAVEKPSGPNSDSLNPEKAATTRKTYNRQHSALNDNSFITSSGSESEATPKQARRSMQATRTTPPPPPVVAGETSTHVQSDLGGDMVLIFEILIVKVPWFRLHGIQFKKIQGGTWQYKDVAGEILAALRL